MNRLLALVFFVCCGLLVSFSTADDSSSATLAITQVNIINVLDGSIQYDRTVLIEGNKIQDVGESNDIRIPSSATVIDGTDYFLIPGLWDMHVHALHEEYHEYFMKLFIVNGVTGFRDAWGELPVAQKIRSEVESRKRVAPRFIVAGNLVDGPDPFWPGSIVVDTPERARAFVDEQKAAGADFIKVYNGVPPEAYFALAERANEIGIPFAGHIPSQVSVASASDAGQRCVEHVYGVLKGFSTQEEQLLKRSADRARAKAAGDSVVSSALFLRERDQVTLSTQDETLTRELLDRLARNETWQTPTLVTMRGMAFQNEMSKLPLDQEYRSKYFEIPDYWSSDTDPMTEGYADEDWRIIRSIYTRILRVVGQMQEAGVPLLAGTDTPNPGAFPGFGLHDELQLLVEAGLTPLQALQAATLNPARFQHAEDTMGQVAPGMLADLVLLESNPLSDIENTRRIHAVVLNGKLLDRATLDAMLVDLVNEVERE